MLLLLATALAFQIGSPGQYPGQYPPGQYPPGQYPQGRYPGSQGPGIPIPGRGKKKTSTDKADKKEEPTSSYTGRLRTINEKSFEINAPDTRTLVFQINDKTKKPDKLAAGDYVAVEAREDENGYYIAVTVTKTDPPAGEEHVSNAHAETPGEPAPPLESGVNVMRGPKYDAGDEGAPKLKRGKPVTRAKTSTEEDTATVPVTPAAASVEPASTAPAAASVGFIEKAKAAAAGFLSSLPNFVCAQHTTRFVSDNHGKDWRAIDLLSVDVLYDGGREKYEHLTINGKPSNKAAEESGAWSTGEFGTILEDLFSPSTAAKFRYSSSERIAGFDASVYKFTVERPNSHWRVVYRSQYIFPAYRGTVWLDKKTARVVRLEMQASDIPKEFLADTTESAVDYEMVSLGSQKFLLPVHAEILSCQRGTTECDKNVIEFRNYHKFTGESNIIFK